MELQLKHLAPYLPYGLNYLIDFEDGDIITGKVLGVFSDDGEIYLDNHYETNIGNTNSKPILRPLSDLTKIVDKDVRNVYYYRMLKTCFSESDIQDFKNTPLLQRYDDVQMLLSFHFDVFGLIDKELAIDINKL